MAIESHTRQKTLGLIGTGLVTFMQNQIWQGAMEAAQAHGARLVYYPAISLSSSPPFNPQTKILFDFVDSRHLDGLLVWYAGIAEGIGLAPAFFERYRDLPLVMIGGQLKNYPDLSVDNYQGVYSAVEHLIEVHRRKRIAMIRGPKGHPDADERYKGYVEALQSHNLPVNPDNVAETLFELKTTAEIATASVSRWLRDIRRVEIDAIVASSDYMALAAIQAIESHGLRVPEDISVTGFDDVDDSQASIPSITTVRQPFYELGYQATEMLLALTEGHSLPAETTVPVQLVVRESCGCLAKSLSLVNNTKDKAPDASQFTADSATELENVAQDLRIPFEYVENLATRLQNDLHSSEPQQFLPTLKRYVTEALKSHFNAIAWQNAISILRLHALAHSDQNLSPRAETLFNQARILVTEINQRANVRQRLIMEQQIENLRRTSEALITAFGKHILMDTLYEQLPQLGFPAFYLSIYEDSEQPAAWSRLILAYENDHRIDLPVDGLRFPTGRLVPDSMLLSSPATPLVIEPLYFGEEQLGFLALEAGPTEGAVYENLRAQISSALQGSHLLQQIQQHAAQLEQRVDERTAELAQTVRLLKIEISQRQQAEEALRQLNEDLELRVAKRTRQLETANSELESFSYSVSHDLRAPLRAIDGFSQMLMDDFGSALPEEARSFLKRIRSNTKRMGNLIDALLAFSRISRQALQVVDVDMNKLVQEVIEDLRADHVLKQAEIIVGPLSPCNADRSLLKVVWVNLISNSIKYSSKRKNPYIEIQHTSKDKNNVYLIKDNGVGFDMRYANKLFGVFQRLHGMNEYEGTGIGLATVQRIIGRHNGKVWAEAEVDKGATFYFTIGEIE